MNLLSRFFGSGYKESGTVLAPREEHGPREPVVFTVSRGERTVEVVGQAVTYSLVGGQWYHDLLYRTGGEHEPVTDPNLVRWLSEAVKSAPEGGRVEFYSSS
jgi:hypothetical protein